MQRSLLHIIIIALLAVSCTPQKRLARLLDKHPELSESVIDTIEFDTLIFLPPKKAKITFSPSFTDTLRFNQNGFRFSIYRSEDSVSNKTDSITVKVNSNKDSLSITRKIAYPKQVVKYENDYDVNYIVIAVLSGFLFVALLLITIILKIKL
jgi:hypothetical protein